MEHRKKRSSDIDRRCVYVRLEREIFVQMDNYGVFGEVGPRDWTVSFSGIFRMSLVFLEQHSNGCIKRSFAETFEFPLVQHRQPAPAGDVLVRTGG